MHNWSELQAVRYLHNPKSQVTIVELKSYCIECDYNIVDLTDPTTGEFWSNFGYRYTYNSNNKTGVLGEWTQVVCAICSSCLKKEKENATR